MTKVKKIEFSHRDAEEELDKLTKLADRINPQINSSEPPPISNGPQTVDLDQLFNFLSQVRPSLFPPPCSNMPGPTHPT